MREEAARPTASSNFCDRRLDGIQPFHELERIRTAGPLCCAHVTYLVRTAYYSLVALGQDGSPAFGARCRHEGLHARVSPLLTHFARSVGRAISKTPSCPVS